MKLPENVVLDVRPLLAAGREPLDEIMRCVDTLPAGRTLTVVAPFLPAPLIERMRGLGFSAQPARRADGAWEVFFIRR